MISVATQQFRKLMSSDEERNCLYSTSTKCVIWSKDLMNDRAIHHDRSSGNIIGLAHNECKI